MYLAVQECLDDNPEKWNTIPVLVNLKNELDELLQRMQEQDALASNDSKSVTEQKNALRDILTQKTVMMAGAISSFAAITGDDELARQMHLTPSDFVQAKETDIESMVQPVIDAAVANSEALADYGVLPDQVTELETSLDDFKEKIGKPRHIRNQKFAAIKMIDQLIDEGRDLLTKKLDKLMIRFRYSDESFYDSYNRARTIVDR